MPQSPLPKWLMKRYSLLWQAFGKREFQHSETCRVLKGDGKDFVSEVLSGLKKAQWLEVRINPQDSRKRVYRFISLEEAVNHLSEDKAKVAVSFLEFLEEKECWEATREILKDRELMASIQRGKEDIATGKVRPRASVKAASSL